MTAPGSHTAPNSKVPARITIAMPVYNAGRHVELAIRSILAQSVRDWKLVIVDDGSTDDTSDRVARFTDPRIELVRGAHNRGLPARLNQIIEGTETPLLARMDGDDVSYPERFARQFAYLDAHPDCDVVATNLLVVGRDGEPRGLEKWRGASHERVIARPWSGFHFNHATWLGRTEWFRRFRYRADALRCEDDDLMLRAYRSSRFARLQDVLYAYRVGPLDAGATGVARRSYMRSLLRESWRQRQPTLLAGIPLNAAKWLVEAGVSKLGVERWLRHRAGDLPREVAEDWERVRGQLFG